MQRAATVQGSGSGGAPGHWCAVPYSLLRRPEGVMIIVADAFGSYEGTHKAKASNLALAPTANRTRAVLIASLMQINHAELPARMHSA